MHHRAAGKEAGLEARALLVGERGDLDRDRQALVAAIELGHAGDAEQDAEVAVVFSAIADRIEVRADEERFRARGGALVAADHVADRVGAHRHPRLAHPCGDDARHRAGALPHDGTRVHQRAARSATAG